MTLPMSSSSSLRLPARLTLLPALAVLASSACPDFVIPPDTPVACGGGGAAGGPGDTCPPTWHCEAALARCVPDAPPERDAPVLIDGTGIDATRVAAGTPLEITIVTDEPLALPPVVAVVGEPGAEGAVPAELVDGADASWRLRYIVEGFAVDTALQPSVALVDRFGNAAVRDLPGVDVDVTGPAATDIDFALAPPQTRAGELDTLPFAAKADPGTRVDDVRLVRADGTVVATAALPTIDAAGVVAGDIVTPAAASLVDGETLFLELALSDDLANTQVTRGVAGAGAVVVDLVTPSGTVVVADGGGLVRSVRSLLLAIDVDESGESDPGELEMIIEGDVDGGAGVGAFGPVLASASVTLSDGDGAKVVRVRFRDQAFNEGEAQVALILDTAAPASAPVIDNALLAGIGAVKANDTLAVSGAAGVDDVVSSVELVFTDAAGAAACAPVVVAGGGVSALGGQLQGTVNVGTPCAGAARVQLRVIVRSPAGVTSDPLASTSNALAVDVAGPVITAASLVAAAAPDALDGFAPSADVLLTVDATDAHLEGAQVSVGRDVVAGAPVGAFVPLPQQPAAPFALTLAGGNGAKLVDVTVRDAVGNTSTTQLGITVDALAPFAPRLDLITLRERVRDAALLEVDDDAPAGVDDANAAFTLSGVAGAAEQNQRLFVFADVDPALTPDAVPSDIVDVAGNGSFPAVDIGRAALTWHFVVVDGAGNRSAAADVTRLILTFAPAPALPASIGDSPFAVTITSNVAPAAPPVLTLGPVTAALAGPPPAPGATTFDYVVDADAADVDAGAPGALVEGLDDAVLRARAVPAGLAAGSSGTDAVVVSVDFTPPAIDPDALGLVVVSEATPPADDSVAGLAGAILDFAGFESVVVERGATVTIQGRPQAGASAVDADGSFAPLDLDDNAVAAPVLVVTDAAGNVTTRTLANDIAGPAVAAVADVAAAADGDTVVVSVTVLDAAHPLSALPTVTLGGRALTPDDPGASLDVVAPGAGGGGPQIYSYRIVVDDALDPQNVAAAVSAVAVDAVGNAGTGTDSVRIDFTPPTVAHAAPAEASFVPAPLPIALSGSAVDGGGGSVALVEVAVQDLGSGLFFNAVSGAFDAPGALFAPASGTSSWSFAVGALVTDGTYRVSERAVDAVGNLSGITLATFTFDDAAPNTFFVTPPPASSTDASLDFEVGADEDAAAIARFECSVDGAAFSTCAPTGPLQVTIDPLTPAHALLVRAVDRAGNVDPSPAQAFAEVRRARYSSIGAGTGCSVDADGFSGAADLAGTLACWGDNSDTHMGDPSLPRTVIAPTVIDGVGNDLAFKAVSTAVQPTICGIAADGALVCWGDNTDLAAGSGAVTAFFPEPAFIDGGPFIDVSLGDHQGCAVRASGVIACWGREFTPFQTPRSVVDISPEGGFVRVVVGAGGTACALQGSGVVKCFGKNDKGQLGQGFADPLGAPSPQQVFGLGAEALAVAVGREHVCALVRAPDPEQRRARCWGGNALGQISGFVNDVDPVLSPQQSALPPLTSLAAAGTRTCGVTFDGDLACIGAGSSAELGDGVAGGAVAGLVVLAHGPDPALGRFDEVVAGAATTCVTRGTQLACLGDTGRGEIVPSGVHLDEPALSVTSFMERVVARGRTTCTFGGGTLSCAGDNDDNVYALSAGGGGGPQFCSSDNECGPASRCVQDSFGFGFCDVEIGRDTFALVPGGGDARSFAIGDGFACRVRGFDRRIECAGREGPHLGRGNQPPPPPGGPEQPPFLDDVDSNGNYRSVAAGEDTVCAVRDDGGFAVECWGENEPFDETDLPEAVAGVFQAEDVVVGDDHACAFSPIGVTCWGSNAAGQLGRGNAPGNVDVAAPIAQASDGVDLRLGGGGFEQKAAAASNTTCMISDQTRRVYCWGDNSTGLAGRPRPGFPGGVASLATPSPIDPADGVVGDTYRVLAMGERRACAVHDSGRLVCWGVPLFPAPPGGPPPIEDPNAPAAVGDDDGWEGAVGVGDDHVCGRFRDPLGGFDPLLGCVGRNTGGAFGDGNGIAETLVEVLP